MFMRLPVKKILNFLLCMDKQKHHQGFPMFHTNIYQKKKSIGIVVKNSKLKILNKKGKVLKNHLLREKLSSMGKIYLWATLTHIWI